MNKHFSLLWCLWVLIVPKVWSTHTNELMGGDAFTDSHKIIEMPKKWVEKPIQYKNWAKEADLAITLDQQLYPALLPVIQQYARQNKLEIAVQEGTCGISNKGLKDKAVDIAGFCCPAGEADRMVGIKFHTLGIAAIALIVNPNNPVNNLSLKQARQIFQGNLFRWSDIKGIRGSRRIIQALGRLHCKQRPGHWRLLLDHEDLFSPRLFEVGTISDMLSEVAFDPYAIGYETLWMVKLFHRQSRVKTLSINHIKPQDNAKLIAGDYSLYRTYNVTTWESAQTKNQQAQILVSHLINYMGRIDPKYGIVPVSKLRQAGWKFLKNELIGEPDK